MRKRNVNIKKTANEFAKEVPYEKKHYKIYIYNRNGKPMRNNINHVESVEESILNVIESGKSTLYIRLDTYGYIYMLFRIDTSRMEEGIISLHKIKKIVAIRTGEN